MDNVFIERLWRSLKYECVYLHAFETGLALHAGLLRWISHYNTRRPHSSLAGRTPDEAYNEIGSTPSPGHAPATVSSLKLPAHSDDSSHRFRSKPATCSERSQPGIPMIPAG